MKKEINITLGQRIRKTRSLNGYTREAFAKALSVSPRLLADVETGASGVSISNLKKISQLLNIPTDYFLGLSNLTDADLLRLLASNKIHNLDDEYMDYVNTILDCVAGIAEI